jgi:predicted sulfurtransferase
MDATRQQEQHTGDGGGDRYGVLLYYKYAEVPDSAALAAFYEAHCRGLALVGRVRVGPDGVNATVRTPPTSLSSLHRGRILGAENSSFVDL